MTIHNEHCLDTTKWTSQGIMGSILEEIRTELAGPDTTPLPPLPDFKKPMPTESYQANATPGTTSSEASTTLSSNRAVAIETNHDTSSSSSSEEGSDAD